MNARFCTFIFLALVISFSSVTAFALTHRVIFDQPLSLRSDALRVTTERVSYRRNSDNSLVDGNTRKKILDCNAELHIEGRDLATENDAIGEHYFGKMLIDCSQASWEYKMTFDRVLFLGVRNCVEAETMVGSDLCNLEVIAFRSEKQDGLDRGVLRRDKKKRKAFYRVHSDEAKTTILEKSLYPQGMVLDQIDSYQKFTVSITNNANQFFISRPTETSNFTRGENHYLRVVGDSAARDETLARTVESSLHDLDLIIDRVETSNQPLEALEAEFSTFTNTFVIAAKNTLSLISPVLFHRFDQRLKETQYDLLSLVSDLQPVSRLSELPLDYSSSLRKALSSVESYFPPATSANHTGAETLWLEIQEKCLNSDYPACVKAYTLRYPSNKDLAALYKICSQMWALYSSEATPQQSACLFRGIQSLADVVPADEPILSSRALLDACGSPKLEVKSQDRCAVSAGKYFAEKHTEHRAVFEGCIAFTNSFRAIDCLGSAFRTFSE